MYSLRRLGELMKEKRLLVLGAGEAQLQIIEAALKQGIYTIVCDKRDYMKGTRIADKYYCVDYMDREAILRVAEDEKVDGVVSNSEPAMINVAWLSEQLHLPGNKERSVETLLSKTAFRELQESVGVFAPKHCIVSDESVLQDAINLIGYPLVIKPVLSSGTRGTTIIKSDNYELATQAYRQCADFSRDHIVSIEQYVPMSELVAYDAELFVHGNDILWDGLYASFRTDDAPMLPMMESLPLDLEEDKIYKIKEAIASGVVLGEFNAESYFTPEGDVFVIEINPRQGGNHIPDLVLEHAGVDFTSLLCTTAVGDNKAFEDAKNQNRKNKYVTMHVVFSMNEGQYQGLTFSETIKPYVVWHENVINEGESVSRKKNAGDAVAFVMLSFPTQEKQRELTREISMHIKPIVMHVGG